MAYLFPLKTQINIKIERIIVLIKPTSDNTLLIFLISFLWSRFLEIGSWTLKLFKSARIIGMGDKKTSRKSTENKNQVFWQLFGERVEIDFFSKFVSVLF